MVITNIMSIVGFLRVFFGELFIIETALYLKVFWLRGLELLGNLWGWGLLICGFRVLAHQFIVF